MKNFILAMRDFKKLSKNDNLKVNFCWFYEESKWFVSVGFSKEYIQKRNFEIFT